MPGGRQFDSRGVRFDHEIHERRAPVRVEAAQEVALKLEHLARGVVVQRKGAQRAAELAHYRGGMEAATDDVADCDSESPAGKRERVVPVTADLGRCRRYVATGNRHPRHVGQGRYQVSLQCIGQPLFALGQAALDRDSGTVTRALQEVRVLVGEFPARERSHVQYADHAALHEQRHTEQRLEALLAQ